MSKALLGTRRAISGGRPRRNHVRGLRVVAGAAALALALGACGSGGGSSVDELGEGDIPEVAENQTLTVGVATLQQQYADPVLANEGGNTYPIKWSVGEPLLRQDLNAKFVPALATEWEVSEDGRTWTFKLREGVKMHDGSDFDAEDVKASIERVSDPEFTSYATFAGRIDKVEVIDPLTVAVTSKEPYATLPMDIPAPIASDYYEKVGEKEFRKAPVAAGPFKFVSQKFNDSMTLESFKDFWDKDRIANFKTLVLKIIPDESSRVAGLQTGQIDIAQGISPNSAAQLENDKSIRLIKGEAASQGHVLYMDNYFPEDSPLKDPNVRKALTLAVDRQAIADSLYRGFGSVPANNTFPVTLGNDPSLTALPYNPDEAKQLLADAGASNLKFTLTLYNATTAVTDVQKMAEAVVGYWKEIGVEATLDVQDPATYLDSVVKHQLRGAIVLGMPGLLMADPQNYQIFFGSDGGYTTVKDPKLDTMFADMSEAMDPADKEAIAKEMGTYLYDQSYSLPVVSLDAVYAVGPTVADFELMSGNPYAGPFWSLRAK
ncbi:ABC transporter substrate-binding protein [Nocardioides daejeonensis]|uniref:ABC transporter substrate-binding protein n=1 Tax=Nocardioides daejeonensis TaxID=1046556 RepID=UPI0013A58FF4|nr:ABC transporter substrate-binding protein [Nocardioides daejeonensis]